MKLDKYHRHEALDRASTLVYMVDKLLLEHPYIAHHKKLRKKVRKAFRLLYQTYQDVGL